MYFINLNVYQRIQITKQIYEKTIGTSFNFYDL